MEERKGGQGEPLEGGNTGRWKHGKGNYWKKEAGEAGKEGKEKRKRKIATRLESDGKLDKNQINISL